jgi:hypothetical protein
MSYTPDLTRVLTVGARYREEQTEYLVERHSAGDVHLPTGRVTACDPLGDPTEVHPFTVTIPAGTYPLYAWVAVLSRDGVEQQRRVAALQLEVSDQAVARYEMALTAGQNPAELDADEFFGFPTAAAAATLADLTAIHGLAEWEFSRIDATYIPAQMPTAPVPGGIYSAVTDEATGANVTAVSPGWGDGAYPTFIGYTGSGAVASVVTDFMVIPGDAAPVAPTTDSAPRSTSS